MIMIISIVYLISFVVLMYVSSCVIYDEANNLSYLQRPLLHRHRRVNAYLYE